mgnify:CR=1 FL=1
MPFHPQDRGHFGRQAILYSQSPRLPFGFAELHQAMGDGVQVDEFRAGIFRARKRH